MKKIVLSHINPVLLNEVLEEYIKNELKFELCSKISNLRLNPYDPIYGHIINWRERFYTNSEFEKR